MQTELMNELYQVAASIENSIRSHLQEQIDRRGVYDHSRANWASELHHPCDRFLVYARLNWRDRKPVTVDSKFRLDEGVYQEDKVADLLARAGWRLHLAQMPLEWPKFEIRGKIDGAIIIGKKEYPAEVKSVSPWYWDQTKTVEQIKQHSKFWISRIPSQLNLYLLMKERPAGFLILVTFGKMPRILPMSIDYDLGELDLKQAERINKYVREAAYPPRIEYRSDVCGLCAFEHICQPVKIRDTAEASPAQVKNLRRIIELEPAVKEHRKLMRELIGSKDKPGPFYGKNLIVEDIEIISQQIEQAYYDVPPEIKDKYRKKRKIIRTKISVID